MVVLSALKKEGRKSHGEQASKKHFFLRVFFSSCLEFLTCFPQCTVTQDI